MSTIVTRAGKGSALTHTEVDANFTNLNTDKVEKTGTDPVVISANSASDALRITQVGTGNALVVEDSANPDSTPFVIDASGRVLNGSTTSYNLPYPATGTQTAVNFQQHGIGTSNATMGITSWSTSGQASGALVIAHSMSGTVGTPGALGNNNSIGFISFAGDDGTNFIQAASIEAEVDGTPGTNDMPGRLVFSTTADGASTPTERMRIDSSGNVGIGISSGAGIVAPLQVSVGEPGGETIRLAWNTGTTTQGFSSIGFSTTQTATQPNALIRGEEIDTSDYRGNLLFATRATNVSTDAPTTRLTIDYNGLVSLDSASGLSIGRTSVTSPAATDGNVFSGTYTPTQVSTNTNVAAITYQSAQFMRIGDTVTVSGRMEIDAIATGNTIVQFSLPIASNFASTSQGSGTGAFTSGTVANNSFARLSAQSTDDCILLQCNSTNTSSVSWFYTFTYRIT